MYLPCISPDNVRGIGEEVVEPTQAIATTVDSSFISGLAKIDQRLVISLDLGQVLPKQEEIDLSII
jgi:chemotaxis signal transduction protein